MFGIILIVAIYFGAGAFTAWMNEVTGPDYLIIDDFVRIMLTVMFWPIFLMVCLVRLATI